MLKIVTKLSLATVLSVNFMYANYMSKTQKISEHQKLLINNKIREINKKTSQYEREKKDIYLILLDNMKTIPNLLAQNNYKKANLIITKDMEKLERLIKNKNIPKLFLINKQIKKYIYIGKIENIPKYKKAAFKLYKENNLVGTRTILNNIKNEIDITYLYLPLKSLYDTMKKAKEKIKNKNKEMAISYLKSSVKMFTAQKEIIPLNMLGSIYFIKKANKVYTFALDEALIDLNKAIKEIKKLKTFGYIPNEDFYHQMDFKSFYAQLIKDLKRLKIELKEKRSIDQKLFNNILKQIISVQKIEKAYIDFFKLQLRIISNPMEKNFL